MKKIFELLFSGCWHHWQEYDKKSVGETEKNVILGYAVFCKCTKCGEHKRFDLY